jgi:hypothetical protein
MNVKDLIEDLQRMPPDSVVKFVRRTKAFTNEIEYEEVGRISEMHGEVVLHDSSMTFCANPKDQEHYCSVRWAK